MKFPAEDIGRIRRGEITVAIRRFEGTPTSYRPADRFNSGLHVIERVDQLRTDFPIHDAKTGARLFKDGEPRVFTLYEPKAVSIEEFIVVTATTRMPLNALDDDYVAGAGFEDRDELVDYYSAELDCAPDRIVWVITFEFATDVPRLLAWPHSGKAGHGDYVHSGHDVLVHEPEAIDAATVDAYARRAREVYEHDHAPQMAEDEARRLERKLKELRKRASRTGVNVTLEVAVINHQLEEIERKLDAA